MSFILFLLSIEPIQFYVDPAVYRSTVEIVDTIAEAKQEQHIYERGDVDEYFTFRLFAEPHLDLRVVAMQHVNFLQQRRRIFFDIEYQIFRSRSEVIKKN